MATTQRTGLPEVWASNITALLSGEASCGFAPWLKAHFRIEKIQSTFDFGAWRVDHTALMDATVADYTAQGWKCAIENQNYLRVTGQTCVLVCKPDIVARKGPRVKILDCKTGTPRDKDGVQVAVYMIAAPLAWNAPKLADFIEGEVIYRTHTVPVPVESVGPIRARLFDRLRRLGSVDKLEAVPSEQECHFCDVTAVDCPQRWVGETAAPAMTEDF